MLISHRFKFIYTKTVKTASTSIESYFEKFCMNEGEWVQTSAREAYESSSGIIGYRGGKNPKSYKWWNHMPAQAIKERIGDDKWGEYFKFCVIRNPYEKCISAFEYFGKKYQIKKTDLLFYIQTYGLTHEQRRFLHWLSCSLESENSYVKDRDKYVIDGIFCMDDFIKYENLHSDTERICQKIGVPWEPERVPSFKSGKRRRDATIDNLYSERARKIVEEIFEFEIREFDYTFPGV